MARNKEVNIVLLDVGSSSSPYIEDAKEAISSLMTSKMLFKASHEMALVLFGTDGTNNALHQEFKDQGDDTQYLHISSLINLQPPTTEDLGEIAEIRCEGGTSDFMNALATGVDIFYKTLRERPELERATVSKRIFLISTFFDQVEEDDGQFAEELRSKMDTASITLDVYAVAPGEDEETRKAQHVNLATLDKLTYLRKPRIVQNSAELKGLFPLKESVATAYYSGPLMIGQALAINVKVTKKSSQERMPAMNKHSDLATTEDAQHTVSYDKIYKKGNEEVDDEEYAPEDMGKAYKYGAQIVPMPKEQELALKYAPDKAFAIVGAIAQDTAPRHLLTGDTWLVAPEKGNEEACTAVTALCSALSSQQIALLARFVPRANGEVNLCILTPYDSNSNTDCFVMNSIPYEADIRAASFTTFAKKPEVLPTKQQLSLMDGIVDAHILDSGDMEQCAPEAMSNPSLHVFLRDMTLRALDSREANKFDDTYISDVLDGSLGSTKESRSALEEVKGSFAMREKPQPSPKNKKKDDD